jgi:hypothetical protein
VVSPQTQLTTYNLKPIILRGRKSVSPKNRTPAAWGYLLRKWLEINDKRLKAKIGTQLVCHLLALSGDG